MCNCDECATVETEEQAERRLVREAATVYLGTLGNPEGINVAKVQVSWYFEDAGLGFVTSTDWHAGYYLVHATGDEPEANEDEFSSIYTVFENLTHEAMQARQERQGFADYQIDDVSSH